MDQVLFVYGLFGVAGFTLLYLGLLVLEFYSGSLIASDMRLRLDEWMGSVWSQITDKVDEASERTGQASEVAYQDLVMPFIIPVKKQYTSYRMIWEGKVELNTKSRKKPSQYLRKLKSLRDE